MRKYLHLVLSISILLNSIWPPSAILGEAMGPPTKVHLWWLSPVKILSYQYSNVEFELFVAQDWKSYSWAENFSFGGHNSPHLRQHRWCPQKAWNDAFWVFCGPNRTHRAEALSYRRKSGQIWESLAPIPYCQKSQENPNSKRYPLDLSLLNRITGSILQCNPWAVGWSLEGTS